MSFPLPPLARTQFPPSSSCKYGLSDTHYQFKEQIPFSERAPSCIRNLSSQRAQKGLSRGLPDHLSPTPWRLRGWVGRPTETGLEAPRKSLCLWIAPCSKLLGQSRRVRGNAGAISFLFLLPSVATPDTSQASLQVPACAAPATRAPAATPWPIPRVPSLFW